MSYVRDVLLFCSSRIRNRGADAIGRYGIYVKTVLFILFEGFTKMPTFVGVSPPRSHCLVVYWNWGGPIWYYWDWGGYVCNWDCRFTLAIPRVGFGIAVWPWQRWRMIWGCCFTLAMVYMWKLGLAVLPGNWWYDIRDLSYRAPNRGAVCGMR